MENKVIKIFFLWLIIPMFGFGCKNEKTRNSASKDNFFEITEKYKNLDSLKLKITVGDKILFASLVDSKTAREFLTMLPLTLTMNDLNGREKYSSITNELSKEGKIKTSFQKDDISYWLGDGIAIFYNQDNCFKRRSLSLSRRKSTRQSSDS